jgi:glucose uptake protein GlcU
MTVITGIALALLSAVFFGIYMVPRKLVQTSNHVFLSSVVCGMVASVALYQLFIPNEPWPTSEQLGWTVIAGLIWAASTFCFSSSVRHLGLASATTIKNTTAVWGTLAGLVVFAEYTDTHWIPAVAGSFCVVISAWLIDRISRDPANGRDSRMDATGIALAVAASLGYAIYAIPVRMVVGEGLSYVRVLLGMSLGATVGVGLAMCLSKEGCGDMVRQGRRQFLLSALGGVLWTLAMLCLVAAFGLVGLAVSWPLSNINTVIATTIGAVWFHEISLRRRGGLFTAALAVAVLGVALLAWSRM